MYRVLKLSIDDLKNTIKDTGFAVSVILALVYLLFWLVYKPSEFDIRAYQEEFFKALYMILIFYSCSVFLREFSNHTYRIIFTSKYSRSEILVSKLIHFIMLSLIFWLMIQVLNPLIGLYIGESYGLMKIFNVSTIKSCMVYITMAMTIGTFSLFIGVITLNMMSAFVIAFSICWNTYFFAPIFMNLGDKLGAIWKFICNNPFYIIVEGIQYQSYTPKQIIILVAFWMMCFIPSIVILNKREIKK